MERSKEERLKRFRELAAQSEGQFAFYFTDFLIPADAVLAVSAAEKRMVKTWGGAEDCERVMVRFGDPALFGYEEEFPIVCLQIRPVQEKFSDMLTHRDFLGALMNLGIRRETLGDVIVLEHTAWVFAQSRIAPVILQELRRVKHTSVEVQPVTGLPAEAVRRFEKVNCIVPSVRMDAIAAKLCHLSRGRARELFASGRVLLNGEECENPVKVPRDGDVIVIRGYGKYRYRGEERVTGKGNPVLVFDRSIS